MTADTSGTWFQRHPRRALGFVYLLIVAGFLGADFVASNIHQSVTDLALYERQVPIGHRHKADFDGYFGMRFWDPFKNRIHFNNLGFRNDIPFNAAATAGKRVVFTLGDSTTAAFEVPLRDSYPYVLGEALGADFAVFNAGVRAFDTQQVIIHYLTRLKAFKPYAVIYMISPNDFPHNVYTDYANEYVGYFGKGVISDSLEISYCPPRHATLRATDWLHAKFKTNFNLTSFVCKAAQSGVRRIRGGKAAGEPAEAAIFSDYNTPETLRRMKLLLRFLDQATAADGVKLYVTFFPGCAQHPDTAETLPEFRAYAATRDFVNAELPHTTFIPAPDLVLREYRADARKPAFSWKNNFHANVYGNRELGRLIAPYLVR